LAIPASCARANENIDSFRWAGSLNLDSRELVQHFEKLLGQTSRAFRAPGRVNLIGEHTDYNDGFVMPAAVGFSTYVAIAKRPDRKLLIHSEEFPEYFEFNLDLLPQSRTGQWCDYVLGVARVLQQRGYSLPGANLLVHGEVPIGAGLSSSTGLALTSIGGIAIPLPEVARLCRQAENEFVGARVGIMDQFVSCMAKKGHALLLDCRSLDFQFVPIPPGIRLVVCNTMVKHDLATGAYNTRREECEQGVRYFASRNPEIKALRDVSIETLDRYADDLPAVIRKRCTHVVFENQRTIDLAHALTAVDWPRVGQLMRESHNSLRDLYEVSCRELDIMVDAAEGLPGFVGGRMTGGGFGGCTINLVRETDAEDFAAKVAELYRKATGTVAQTYLCTAADGASEVS
jgi:galactokinase